MSRITKLNNEEEYCLDVIFDYVGSLNDSLYDIKVIKELINGLDIKAYTDEEKKDFCNFLENTILQVSTQPPLVIHDVDGMLFLINTIRETDKYISEIYLNGGCYQFHLMLKKFVPECEARITKDKNHIVTYFKDKHFDITGIVEGQFEPLSFREIEMASKWSFAKNKAIQIGECPVCEEPIVI